MYGDGLMLSDPFIYNLGFLKVYSIFNDSCTQDNYNVYFNEALVHFLKDIWFNFISIGVIVVVGVLMVCDDCQLRSDCLILERYSHSEEFSGVVIRRL